MGNPIGRMVTRLLSGSPKGSNGVNGHHHYDRSRFPWNSGVPLMSIFEDPRGPLYECVASPITPPHSGRRSNKAYIFVGGSYSPFELEFLGLYQMPEMAKTTGDGVNPSYPVTDETEDGTSFFSVDLPPKRRWQFGKPAVSHRVYEPTLFQTVVFEGSDGIKVYGTLTPEGNVIITNLEGRNYRQHLVHEAVCRDQANQETGKRLGAGLEFVVEPFSIFDLLRDPKG